MSDWEQVYAAPTYQRCPICAGHGIVPHGFYDHPAGQSFGATSTSPEPCRACKGGGLLLVPPERNP